MGNFFSKFGFVKTGSQQVVGSLQDGTAVISAAAQEKVNNLLADYKEVIVLLKQIGIKVNNFQITTGVGVPQVTTNLSGSIGTVKSEEIKKLIESKANNKLLGLMLNPLLTVKEFQEKSVSELDQVTIHVVLGLPPKVTINLS
ncbi:hypothetical protein WN50_14525 [Limnoraphis robusta CS-951]|jgi:hypothetical protein|uniref:Uncharacterized protein n=1 Tax=Limnoraphis robusta CS-951 TaxID=1637645 RepID=A0A0F5YEU9_9CYAN|nr:hypothetical protein WN50_14525 [Limnoraphis robusta CS-951]MCG5057002.1 hypothetical protein [Limnoraphis sp. WC205]